MDSGEMQDLARRTEALRRDVEEEHRTLLEAREQVLKLRWRCDLLTRDIETALKQGAILKREEEGVVSHDATAAPPSEPVAVTPSEPEPIAPVAGSPSGAMNSAGFYDWLKQRVTGEAPASGHPPEGIATEAPATRASLEATIGSYWLSRIGAVTMLVAFVIFAAWIQNRVTPAMRVAAGYGVAALLIAIGVWAERAYPKFSRPVLSAGLVLTFFMSFAGHFLEPTRCMSLEVSTLLMLASAAAVVGVAGVLRSEPMGALALGMGIWTAVFATALTPSFTLVMLLFLCAVAVAMFAIFRWATALLVAMAGVYVCGLWWMMQGRGDWTQVERFRIEMGYATAWFALFAAADFIDRLRHSPIAPPAFMNAVPGDQAVLTGRFLNPIAYFLVGTFVFLNTGVYADSIQYFYWPLGILLAAIGYAGRRIEREAASQEDVYYVMASGLITLGLASALDRMNLSNVLAFEGLCLFVMRQTTRRSIFFHLSLVHYAIAFIHFNTVTFEDFRSMLDNDWRALASGLPAVLFTLAPTFLAPLWREREDAAGESGELLRPVSLSQMKIDKLAHARTLAGSVLLLRLLLQTIRPDTGFGLLVALVLATAATAWLWPQAQTLWTLAGSLLVWAQGYFFSQIGAIKAGAPAWALPAGIAMTLLVLAAGMLVEKKGRGEAAAGGGAVGRVDSWRRTLSGALLILAVTDITLLVGARCDPAYRYAVMAAIAYGLLLAGIFGGAVFACAAGFGLVVAGSVMQLGRMIESETGFAGPPTGLAGEMAFFTGTLIGVGLTVAFERSFRIWAAKVWAGIVESGREPLLLGRDWAVEKKGRLLLGALITVLLVALVHYTPWIGAYWETVGVTAIAAGLFAAGVAFRSALYRRFGLGVFALAIVRLYAVDLMQLKTEYKIIGSFALAVVLLLVSWLYTRFRTQFERWV